MRAKVAEKSDACCGLITFQRVPPNKKGIELLDHMLLFMKRRLKPNETMRPSAYAGDIEMSEDQQTIRCVQLLTNITRYYKVKVAKT